MKTDRITSLDAIYEAEEGPAFMTGIQALVRLPLMQRRLDRKLGRSTAGLISGYRGSPIGAYDQQLWRARKYLDEHDVVFQPGLNEDLAATALWGAQMHGAFGPTRADGVFGIWYGKGNGVDRTGDAFRNANMLGTSSLGGVLAIGGDDHSAQSSMFPHQTDGIFQSVMMPILQPADVSEILSLGLAGIALSRFAGVWVAMKTIAEVVESASTFDLPDPYPLFVSPREWVPPHGLNWDPRVAWPAERLELERRMIEERIPAVVGWAIANGLDRPVFTPRNKRFCVVTVGKAHQDLMQALTNLGIGEEEADTLGLSIYKVAMSWPLAAAPLIEFAHGSQEILVVEEKAGTVEGQLKSVLFNRHGGRPRVSGKRSPDDTPLLPTVSEFDPLMVARALVARLPKDNPIDLVSRLAALEISAGRGNVVPFPSRKPFFCSGCPHNSSTKTPEGSISGGGIGCHVMALAQPKLKTATFSQMGGEGVQWVGAAPFSQTSHIFQNIGDGTYQHSGILAIRAALAAGTNITFKILYNDAVAMTGGQPAEGAIAPDRVVDQLLAEGIEHVRFVSDDPARWQGRISSAVSIHHRDDLDAVQRELRDVAGVSAILYEQTCAAEKRRRRKRGAFPDPDRRLFINPRVCEGCGDCSVQSNCIAIEPLSTSYGTKRRINQSSCNKDVTCVKGFCPSFVEVEGAVIRKPNGDRIKVAEATLFPSLPSPEAMSLSSVYNVYVAGIGGLGVLTTGALLGTAAHLAGLSATVLDFTGLAQKNGAVVSQVRIAPRAELIHAVRIGAGETDLLLGTDALVAVGPDALRKFAGGRGSMVLNTDETPTADLVTDRDATLPMAEIIETLLQRADQGFQLKATRIAEGLFGNAVASNVLMVGYAWQKGLLPLPAGAFEAAIEANGTAVELNRRAFAWGRVAAHDPQAVDELAGIVVTPSSPETLDALTDRHFVELTLYQNRSYAAIYAALLAEVREAASPLGAEGEAFARSVAAMAYRLMAYKDEYEVARLYGDPSFRATLDAQFSTTRRLSIWLAPPLLSRTDPRTGRPRKRKFGPWIFTALRLVAHGKRLRGTWADPFGRTVERRAERELAKTYIATIRDLCATLDSSNVERALGIAEAPDIIRGFGPVKEAAIEAYRIKLGQLEAGPDDKTLRKAA